MRPLKDERSRPAASTPQKVVIDVAGASGGLYRFERIDDPEHLPAIAGNFLYVKGQGKAATIICAGANETLRKAADDLAAAREAHGALALFIRRNVSRQTRSQEHTDIVEKHQPAIVAAAEFGGR